MKTISPPFDLTCLATASPSLTLTSQVKILAPSFAHSSQAPLPNPDAPPVMIATFPLNRPMTSSFVLNLGKWRSEASPHAGLLMRRPRQRRHEIDEAIALHDDVFAQQGLRSGLVAAEHGLNDCAVFVEGAVDPARNAKLRAPIRPQAPVQ